MSHDWQQVTLVQTPARYRCSVCLATKRWSLVEERWMFYCEGQGFVGRRAPRCVPPSREEEGTK